MTANTQVNMPTKSQSNAYSSLHSEGVATTASGAPSAWMNDQNLIKKYVFDQTDNLLVPMVLNTSGAQIYHLTSLRCARGLKSPFDHRMHNNIHRECSGARRLFRIPEGRQERTPQTWRVINRAQVGAGWVSSHRRCSLESDATLWT